jgi:hypothetical protein
VGHQFNINVRSRRRLGVLLAPPLRRALVLMRHPSVADLLATNAEKMRRVHAASK